MVESEAVFGEELEDTVVQTEMGSLAVATDSRPELQLEVGEEDTEHLDKKRLVLNSRPQ